MTPHLGQGACQAIEDAVVLASVAGTGPAADPRPLRAGAAIDLAAYTSARHAADPDGGGRLLPCHPA